MNDKSFEVPWKSSKKCRYPLRNPGDKPAEGTRPASARLMAAIHLDSVSGAISQVLLLCLFHVMPSTR